jgi:hypothetical protein
MAKSRKKHGANELSLALGISVAILVIGVVVFLLSPKVCTGGDDCKGKAAKQCTEPCKMKHKLFSALMSDEKKQPILKIGGGGKKKTTGLCCDDSTGALCSGYDQSKGRSGCSGANLPPGCSWRPGAQKCTPKQTPKPTPTPTPKPTPKPTPPTPSGQKCLCGAGKMDWQGKECGERGPAGGDDFCMDDYGISGGICGNVGGKTGCEGDNPNCAGFTTQETCDPSLGCKWGIFSDNPQDGCVMTSREPHMMDGPDNQDNVNVRTGPCSGGNVICFDGGECEERTTSIGCQSQCYFPVNGASLPPEVALNAAVQKCNADHNVVEGFRARRRRRCM